MMPNSQTETGGLAEASSIDAAVTWVVHLLTGTVGGSIAILALALLGFGLLQGHLSVRDGLRVVFGCFLLFGAPVLAAGLMSELRYRPKILSSPTVQVIAPQLPQKAPQFDPYAGAAVPDRGAAWP